MTEPIDLGGPKEAQVQSHLPGGANGPKREGTLTSPGEYDWTVRLQRRCGLMSNYFDHLFIYLLTGYCTNNYKHTHSRSMASWRSVNWSFWLSAWFWFLSSLSSFWRSRTSDSRNIVLYSSSFLWYAGKISHNWFYLRQLSYITELHYNKLLHWKKSIVNIT